MALNVSAHSGTLDPLVVTRWRGRGIVFSSPESLLSSPSPISSCSIFRFFSGLSLRPCFPPGLFLFPSTACAYLKKSSSVGSPLSAVGLATPLPFSRLLGFCQVATQRENYQTCCSAVTYTKQLDIILKPPFVEKSSSAGEQVECFHGIQWFVSNTIFRYLSCTAIAEAV